MPFRPVKKILKKIKNRPALNEPHLGRVNKKYIDHYINERTDACHLIVAIKGVASKNNRNWERDGTKAVMYEMLYRYMEMHQVVINREGIKDLVNGIKKNSPKYIDPEKLFTKGDDFLIQVKK